MIESLRAMTPGTRKYLCEEGQRHYRTLTVTCNNCKEVVFRKSRNARGWFYLNLPQMPEPIDVCPVCLPKLQVRTR